MYIENDTDRAIELLLKANRFDEAIALIKGRNHKYIRRIPTGKPKPKYRYIYSINSKHHSGADPKKGEKVRIDHEGTEGHYEVTEVHDDGHVTVRHDEHGHEKKIHKKDLHDLFKDHHMKEAIQVSRKLRRVADKAAKYGTEKQKANALREQHAHAERFGLDKHKLASEFEQEKKDDPAKKMREAKERDKAKAAAKEAPAKDDSASILDRIRNAKPTGLTRGTDEYSMKVLEAAKVEPSQSPGKLSVVFGNGQRLTIDKDGYADRRLSKVPNKGGPVGGRAVSDSADIKRYAEALAREYKEAPAKEAPAKALASKVTLGAEHLKDASRLWHLSRTSLGSKASDSDRLGWVANMLAREHGIRPNTAHEFVKRNGVGSRTQRPLSTMTTWKRGADDDKDHEKATKAANAAAAEAYHVKHIGTGKRPELHAAAARAYAAAATAAEAAGDSRAASGHRQNAEAHAAYADYLPVHDAADQMVSYLDTETSAPDKIEAAAKQMRESAKAAKKVADALYAINDNVPTHHPSGNRAAEFAAVADKWADDLEQKAKEKRQKPKRSDDFVDEADKPIAKDLENRLHKDPAQASLAADASSKAGVLNWNEVHRLHEHAADLHNKAAEAERKKNNHYKARAHEIQAAHHEASLGNWAEAPPLRQGETTLAPKNPREANGKSRLVDPESIRNMTFSVGDTIADHNGTIWVKYKDGWQGFNQKGEALKGPSGHGSDVEDLVDNLLATETYYDQVRLTRNENVGAGQGDMFGGATPPGAVNPHDPGKKEPKTMSVKDRAALRAKKSAEEKAARGQPEGDTAAREHSASQFDAWKKQHEKNPDGFDLAGVGGEGNPYSHGDVLNHQHNSPETAYVVDDYPYGRRLRTQKRYWVETNKEGKQRAATQTKNPKTGRWNAPKRSTYSDDVVWKFDDEGKLQSQHSHHGFMDQDKKQAYLDQHGHAMEPKQRQRLMETAGRTADEEYTHQVKKLIQKKIESMPKKKRGPPKTRSALENKIAGTFHKDYKSGSGATRKIFNGPLKEALGIDKDHPADGGWSSFKVSALSDDELKKLAELRKVEHAFGKSAGYGRSMMDPNDRRALIKSLATSSPFLNEALDKADRCWPGYEPTPGKKPYSEDSCRPVGKKKKKKGGTMKARTQNLNPGAEQGALTKSSGEGSRGGHIVGHTSSGKPIYASAGKGGKHAAKHYDGWSAKDHFDAHDKFQNLDMQGAHHMAAAHKEMGHLAAYGDSTSARLERDKRLSSAHKALASEHKDLQAKAKEASGLAASDADHHGKAAELHREALKYANAMHNDAAAKRHTKAIAQHEGAMQKSLTRSIHFEDRPKLYPRQVEQVGIATGRSVQAPGHQLDQEAARTYASAAVDIALRDAYRHQVMIQEASNPAAVQLTKSAIGTERPSILPEMRDQLDTAAPDFVRTIKGAAKILFDAATNDANLAKGLSALGVSERSLGGRLLAMGLTPEQILMGR